MVEGKRRGNDRVAIEGRARDGSLLAAVFTHCLLDRARCRMREGVLTTHPFRKRVNGPLSGEG